MRRSPSARSPRADSILFRGRVTRLQVEKASRESVTHIADTIRIAQPADSTWRAGEALASWLRELARREIDRLLTRRGGEMGLYPDRVFIRDQKTRWGSCSSRRNLSFNWRLIMAPSDVLDYVVVHELAHLAELSHSPRFWRIVETYCPEHRAHRRWLRENQEMLLSGLRTRRRVSTASLFVQGP